jgi:hypothetical protein
MVGDAERRSDDRRGFTDLADRHRARPPAGEDQLTERSCIAFDGQSGITVDSFEHAVL